MKRKVLILEDELLIAEDLREYITSIGMEVVAIVRSGEEALKVIANCTPDIILMDMKPDGKKDGIITAERLRSRLPRAQFVIVTGLPKSQMNSIANNIRFRLVTKPIDPDELKKAMDEPTIPGDEIQKRQQSYNTR